MKQPNDTQTPDMHPGGAPAFELDHTDAWPTPEPLPEWKPKHESAYHLAKPEGVILWKAEPREKTLRVREWLLGVLKR